MAVTSVSEILRDRPGYNDATRRRIKDLALAMHYRPSAAARQLRGGRSGVIGIMVGLDDPQVNSDRLHHLERVAFDRGFRLLVGQVRAGDSRAQAYLEDFAGRGVDGLIWLPQPFRQQSSLPQANLKDLGAIVSLDVPLSRSGGCVKVDYGAGIQAAVAHLRERGRSRIGLALAGPGLPGDPLEQRLASYTRAVKQRGGEDIVWLGDMTEQPNLPLVEQALRQLVEEKNVDSIIASNDIWAAALIKGLRHRGVRIPEDVAIVGFDNLGFAPLLDPALTTIDQNHEEFARRALELITKIGENPELPLSGRVACVAPMLVARDSS